MDNYKIIWHYKFSISTNGGNIFNHFFFKFVCWLYNFIASYPITYDNIEENEKE